MSAESEQKTATGAGAQAAAATGAPGADPRTFPKFMLREIYEQPHAIRETIRAQRGR